MNRKIQKELLLSLKQLLEGNEIFFWLDFGTLLGAVREKGFIEHDDDMDISLWSKDYWRVRKIIENSTWKYKYIWRRELTIYKADHPELHIDLFFYDEEENTCSFYVNLENKITQDVNIESQVKLNKELFSKFKHIKFLGESFNIPSKTDEYLTANYGNWKNKDTKWYYSKREGINRDHRTIGIIIPTFIREEKMKTCVNSIIQNTFKINRFQPFIRIYIGDQDKIISDTKKEFYTELKNSGHEIFEMPFNCGLSYTRNFLIKQVKEPFVMIIDDDFEFPEQFSFDAFLKLILINENIGIVGGGLNDKITPAIRLELDKRTTKSHLCHIENNNPIIFKYSSGSCQKEYEYYKTHKPLNFFLAKKEMFNDIQWDNELRLVEHSDYCLRLRTTKWKAIIAKDIFIKHNHENNPPEYTAYRDPTKGSNCKTALNLFYEKWNLHNNLLKLNATKIENFYLSSRKIKIVQLARIPCANSGLELSNLINKYSNKFESRYILGSEYSGKLSTIPYRKFPMDLYWQTQQSQCISALKEADIIHVHHDIINHPAILSLLPEKKVIWTLYNLSQSLKFKESSFNVNYNEKVKTMSNLITVADQSLQRQFFDYLTTIRVPLVKMLFNENIIKTNVRPLIVFAPTNRDSTGVATKKYHEVLKVIEELKNEKYDFDFELIEGVPYELNLDKKRKADILIDDVDDTYEKFHNSSLEIACFGGVALTNYSGEDYPFIKTDINNLKETLIKYITNNSLLKEEQRKIIEWRNNNYTPDKLLSSYEVIYTQVYNESYHKVSDSVQKDEIPLSTNANIVNIEDKISDILSQLNKLQIKYCIVKDSCVSLIVNKHINLSTVNIEIFNEEDRKKILEKINSYDLKLDITINSSRNTKTWTCNNIQVNVPLPLIGYLEKYTGKLWTQIIK